MLRIQGEQTETPAGVAPPDLRGGEGFLFFGVLAGSWAVVIGIGWVIWKVVPL
jgi:hypothetical protein